VHQEDKNENIFQIGFLLAFIPITVLSYEFPLETTLLNKKKRKSTD